MLRPVILAKGYECQWYTLHKIKELLDDPVVLNFIETEIDFSESLEEAYILENYCDLMYGERECWGDVTQLKIETVPSEVDFNVEVVDGWETIVYKD